MEKQKNHYMCSKISSKTTKFFLVFFASLLVLTLLFFITIYVFAPSYRFNDPSPFTGKFIHNPYQNMDVENWNYIDFRGDSADRKDIPVYEYGYGLFKTKYLCIDYQSKRKIDYPFFKNIHIKQYNLNCLKEKSSLVVPTNLKSGFKMRELSHLDRYRSLEVISPYGIFFDCWDMALSSGHRVNIIASNVSAADDFVYMTAVAYDDKKQIIESLKNGDSYALKFRKNNDDIPDLKTVMLKGDTIIVEADRMIKEVRFIGQNAVVKDSLCDVNQGVYLFGDEDTYIRTELSFDDGTTMYLNPIVRHEFQYFFDPVTSELMKERTWLMRIIYVFVIIFFIKYLLTYKKEENNEN